MVAILLHEFRGRCPCLLRQPRAAASEDSRGPPDFKQAVEIMNFIYISFDVCVLSQIPDHVWHLGHKVQYLEKGWCCAEAVTAEMAGRLRVCSQEMIREIQEEVRLLSANGLRLPDCLFGFPAYPLEVLQKDQTDLLTTFRKTQQLRGKVFTKGRCDLEQVARIVETSLPALRRSSGNKRHGPRVARAPRSHQDRLGPHRLVPEEFHISER